jgi:hypothetical protein
MNHQLRDVGARELLKAALDGAPPLAHYTVGDSEEVLRRARQELRSRGISLAAQVLAIELRRFPVITLGYHRGLDGARDAVRIGRGIQQGVDYEEFEIELSCARLVWRRALTGGGVA